MKYEIEIMNFNDATIEDLKSSLESGDCAGSILDMNIICTLEKNGVEKILTFQEDNECDYGARSSTIELLDDEESKELLKLITEEEFEEIKEAAQQSFNSEVEFLVNTYDLEIDNSRAYNANSLYIYKK